MQANLANLADLAAAMSLTYLHHLLQRLHGPWKGLQLRVEAGLGNHLQAQPAHGKIRIRVSKSDAAAWLVV
jgi:hypothetical protein